MLCSLKAQLSRASAKHRIEESQEKLRSTEQEYKEASSFNCVAKESCGASPLLIIVASVLGNRTAVKVTMPDLSRHLNESYK